jgi:hypothetical protein
MEKTNNEAEAWLTGDSLRREANNPNNAVEALQEPRVASDTHQGYQM